MVAILEKSDAAQGFEQIIDFLSGSYIHHALTVNLHVYISCIKQFWNTAVVKRSGDVTRLQALVDKKKIVITEEVVREILQLDDAKGVICLPNDEIFAGLARMGNEKPSTKLTFYKAFFSTQWKFFIHTILHSLSAKRTSWNEFSSAMASALIYLSSGQRFNFSKYIFKSLVRSVDSTSKFYMYPRFIQMIIQSNIADLSKHTNRYISPVLTQKVFANMRRVGKGFSGVETPLFENMLAVRAVDVEEEVQVSAQDDVVQEHVIEAIATEVVPPTPNLPSPSSPIIPSTPPHQSPSPPPPQAAEGSSHLVQQVLDKCFALVLRVEGLETANAAQQLEIIKLKAMDVEYVFSQGRISVDMETNKGIELEEDTKVQEAVEVMTTAKLITEVVTAAATQVATASAPIPAAKPKVLKIAATLAVSTRRRKGVVIRDPEEELHTDTPAETHTVKDKGKGILIEDPKPMKKKDQIEMDAEFMKKPQSESEARKNMISYLKNTEGYKMKFFKGKTYDQILPIFQARFDANMKFLFKTRKEMEKEDEEIIKSINETPAQKAAKRRKLSEEAQEADDLRGCLEIVQDEDDDVFVEAIPLAQKVPVVDYQVVVIDNKPRYKIIRADDTHQFYISFTTLLKNFDREDLETLWRIVKDRFSTKKPTKFLDEYLLLTLKTMFGELDEQDAIWRNQKSVHGLALVKRWKLRTSCSVHAIILSTVQLFLLVERRYSLSRFTLEQLVNVARLQVEEENEVTNLQCDYLELLKKCECPEKELSKSKMMSKSFEALQKHAINLEIDSQHCQEKIKNDKSFKENQSKGFCKEREKYFEIQDLKAQLQDKAIAIRVIPTTSVSKPQLKSNQMEDRVLLNDTQGKKQEVEDHRRNVKFSKNKTFVTSCNDSLKAKTSNVNFVCATCEKCVLNEKHDMCVLESLNGVNSRTKMPMSRPVSTREPKRIVNQSVAKPLRKTVASESTNQKPRHTSRKLYEHVTKTCSWWYPKFTPPGYK
nr:hypothetical protein [Tanacetum cinerariifolium]